MVGGWRCGEKGVDELNNRYKCMDIVEIQERVLKEEVIEERLVRAVCRKVQEVLVREGNLQVVSSPIVLVGDIHGQFYDVLKLLATGTKQPTQRARRPRRATSSSATSWTAATTPWRPSCCSSASSCATPPTSSSSAATTSLGTSAPTQPNLLHLRLPRGDHPQVRQPQRLEGLQLDLRLPAPRRPRRQYAWPHPDHIFCVHGGLSPDIHALDQIREIDRLQ